MGKSAKHSIYAFDQFRLDAGTLMLYRVGQAVTLPPKVVKTLAVLVENRGSIVSKEELIELVWEDAIVEESNLSQNLYLLRKTLGKKPDGSAYIETLRRRGYKFTSDNVTVESVPSPPADPPNLETASPPRYSVERHGNVVALVDWKETDLQEPTISKNENPAEPASPAALSETAKRLLIAAAILVAFAGVGIVVWMNSTRAAQNVEETPLEVESLPLTNGEFVSEATISLDGKHFTYHEMDGEYSRIFVQQTGQGKPIEIVPRARRVVGPKTFSPDGQFIYYVARDEGINHSSVYRVPTLGGVSTKIVENGRSHVTFSPDGKSIAFVRDDPVFSLVSASNDGTGERLLLESEPGVSFGVNPAWSPDGKRIAFGRFDQNATPPGKCTLSTLDIETGEVRPLSTEMFDTCHRIEWRRDGKGIVFVGTKLADASTIRRDQVYYMQAADGVLRRLTSDPSRKQEFSLGVTENGDILAVPFTRSSQIWVMDAKGSAKTASRLSNGTADGRAGLVPLRDGRVAFTTRVGENLGVWLMDGDGGNRRQIVSDPANVEELRATPDGKYFFFATERNNSVHIFRVDADGSNMRQITDGESVETDSTASPDGKWIAFASAAVPGGEQRLWRTSIEGGARTKISDQLCAVPHYSPSGKFISCVWDPHIYVISSDDGRLVKSFRGTPYPILNVGSRWTPDEKGLAYIASVKGSANLWVQPIDGKPPKPLTDFVDGDIYNFAFSPDGSKLFLARGYQVRDAILIKSPR